jgi:large subunit ribosomal protein L4
MELAVYNIKGKETGRTVSLSSKVFGIEPNDHAIYLDVKQIQANKRQGTHSARERSEVRGSTRKVKKQKGTGTARFGDIKNPLFRGGGRIFGPRPHEYRLKVNKKVKKLARISALSYKAKDNEITVIESFSFDQPKTKNFIQVLNDFGLQNKKVLLVLDTVEPNVYLSLRNIPKVKILKAETINTYDLLNANQVLITENSLEIIEKIHTAKNEEE